MEHPTTRKKRTPDEARTKRRAEGARPPDLDQCIAADRGYTPAARAAPQHQQRPIGPKRRPEQTGNGSDPCLPEPFSAGLSGGKICNAVTCQLLSPFLRSRRPGQLNYCGRIRPTTLIVGTETGHFPADEPNSVVWSSCSSVCGPRCVALSLWALDDASQTRGCGACSGSLACSRRPFLCVWKPRPVRLCLGLLAPLSAPLPSAVFFLASLRRALGIPPSTALAERQSPAALALVVERSSPASAVASFVVIQPLPAGRCAVRCRTAFRRTTTLRAPAAAARQLWCMLRLNMGPSPLPCPSRAHRPASEQRGMQRAARSAQTPRGR